MLAAGARAYVGWERRCSAGNRRKRSAWRGTGWAGLAGPAGKELGGVGAGLSAGVWAARWREGKEVHGLELLG